MGARSSEGRRSEIQIIEVQNVRKAAAICCVCIWFCGTVVDFDLFNCVLLLLYPLCVLLVCVKLLHSVGKLYIFFSLEVDNLVGSFKPAEMMKVIRRGRWRSYYRQLTTGEIKTLLHHLSALQEAGCFVSMVL